MADYQPGVCNINLIEARRRRAIGIFNLMLAGGLWAALAISSLPSAARVVLIIPIFGGILGLLQARSSFCVAYGMTGIQNADADSVSATRVTADQAIAKDVKRAKQIYVQAILLSVFALVLIVLIP